MYFPQIQHLICDLESRRKTTLLFEDLQSLGVQPWKIQTIADNIFKVDHTAATALGSMYVMEGSTLSGQIISRHLEKMSGEPVKGSLKYLKAYQTKTGSMWKDFLKIFCDITVKNGHEDLAIESAIATFLILKKMDGRTKGIVLK